MEPDEEVELLKNKREKLQSKIDFIKAELMTLHDEVNAIIGDAVKEALEKGVSSVEIKSILDVRDELVKEIKKLLKDTQALYPQLRDLIIREDE